MFPKQGQDLETFSDHGPIKVRIIDADAFEVYFYRPDGSVGYMLSSDFLDNFVRVKENGGPQD